MKVIVSASGAVQDISHVHVNNRRSPVTPGSCGELFFFSVLHIGSSRRESANGDGYTSKVFYYSPEVYAEASIDDPDKRLEFLGTPGVRAWRRRRDAFIAAVAAEGTPGAPAPTAVGPASRAGP